MKKLTLLIFLLSLGIYGQARFPEGVRISGGQPTVTSTNFLTATDATGLQTKIDPVNLPLPFTGADNSAGAVQGFALTNNGDGTVNIASGTAYLRAANDQYAPLLKFTIPAVTNLALTDNANNFLLVDYNGGSPALTVTTNTATINTETNSIALVVSRVGNTLDWLSLVGQNVDANAKLRVRFLNQEGIRRLNGAGIGFSARNLTLSAGVLASGLIRINTPAFNTASPDTFTQVYNNGAVWTRTTGQTQVNNTQYNNAGTLTNLAIGDFRTDYIYLLPNNPSKLYLVLGTTSYTNITNARTATPPASLPSELQTLGVLVGRSIIQRLSANISEVSSAFDVVFPNAPVPEHNALAGLQGGAASDYQHLTTVQLNGISQKNTIAQIRAFTGTLTNSLFITTDLGQEGNWYYDASDTTTADNTGTVLVTADGKRIKRIYSGAVNFKWFGAVGNGVADNSSLFNSVLASFDQLYIPSGLYKIQSTISLSNKTITGDKPTYNGTTLVKGTVVDGGFTITGSYINFFKIGIINGLLSNGFTIRDNAQYINITDCLLNVADHGILTQAFGGTCKNVRVLNCDSFGGIHGFVSKAENVTYENCRAFSPSIDGFAMVSDNFESASGLNNCINNNLINCEAYNTQIGIKIYSRDYFSTNNANNVVLRGLNIVGGNMGTMSAYGVLVGDELATPGGQTYNDVLNISITGITFDNIATAGIKYSRCNGVSTVGTNTTKNYAKDSNSKNVKHYATNITGSSLGNIVFNTPLTVNSTSPLITNGETYFDTANTATTNIINFSGGKVGQVITVFIKDDFTTIINSGNMKVRNNIKGIGSFVTLKFRDNASGWDEINSYIADKFQFFPYTANYTIDYSLAENARTTLTGNVTTIVFSNMIKNSFFRFLIAWDGSTRSITGWDSRIIWLGGNAPSSITDSDRLVLEFYYDGTNIVNTYRSDVINRPLAGYVSGAGTVSASDTVLQAIQKLNGNQVASGVTSGSYTPTVTASTNVTSATLGTASYTKNGNIVTGVISINMQATSINSLSEITLTAPVNRAAVVPNYYVGNGTYQTDSAFGAGSTFFSGSSANTITLRFNSGGSVASAGTCVFTFQYDITK